MDVKIPVKTYTPIAIVSSYALVTFAPGYLLVSKLGYIGTFLLISLIQYFSWASWKVVLWPYCFSPLRHLPHPKPGSLFMGHFYRIRSEPTGKPMMEWINTIPNNGLIRYLGIFNSERVLVTSPKGLSEVLTTKSYDFVKPAFLRIGIGQILGIGLVLAEGEEHKLQRKNLTPAFAYRQIKNLYPVFWDKSCEAVAGMTEQVGKDLGKVNDEKKPYDKPSDHDKNRAPEADQAIMEISDWASRATLDIIGVAGMGRDFGALRDPNTPLLNTYRLVMKPSPEAQRLQLMRFLIPDFIIRNLPIKRVGDIAEAARVIRATCRELIQAKKERLEKKGLHDLDILSVALESGGFTEDNLVDQLMTFLAAGHETTASALTWAIYILCINPDMQTRLREEVRSNLPSPSSSVPISSADFDKMHYLNAFIQEVLRYSAPVPITPRCAANDTTILGQHIPKGTQVFLAITGTNRDKNLWGPDAMEFKPERWLDSPSGGAESNYAFMTFIHGPRSCIGQAFSKSEFACLLAAWVGRFDFQIRDPELMNEDNILIKQGVTARPAKGLWVKARVLEGW